MYFYFLVASLMLIYSVSVIPFLGNVFSTVLCVDGG